MLSHCCKPKTFRQLLDRGWCTHITMLVQNLMKILRATKYLSGGWWKVYVNFDNYVYISILQNWKSMYSCYGERISECFCPLTMLGKAYEKSWVLLGTCCRTKWELWGSMIRNHWKLDRNRFWEQKDPKRSNIHNRGHGLCSVGTCSTKARGETRFTISDAKKIHEKLWRDEIVEAKFCILICL